MNITNLIAGLLKVGIALLIMGKLGQVTYNHAIKMAHEQESGLISLGQLSRQLNH
jgi:hypothetical protein